MLMRPAVEASPSRESAFAKVSLTALPKNGSSAQEQTNDPPPTLSSEHPALAECFCL